ncbi:MAG: OsmC family protein [Actinobacteria bacterium]|nr:OsmC family protein [Actinomycetota bacterium]
MNADELRQVQEPLKDRYQAEPAAAVITLRASGSFDGDDLSCSVQTGRALVEAGLHPAIGGTGMLACPGDMLLQALVGCAGVTLRTVASHLGVEVSGSIRAEGDLDVRGALGVSHDARVGFREIRLEFDLTSDAPREHLDAFIAITERACVVYQTLAEPAALSTTLNDA